jgi:pimeloyl-ACP methyl ester carboxylesterase
VEELFGKVLILLVGGLVMWGVWQASQPRRLFLVRVLDGRARVASGKVTAMFLERVREIVDEHGIKTATVAGVLRGARISLQFSRQFPPPACQQLRNWWEISGWGAVKRRA